MLKPSELFKNYLPFISTLILFFVILLTLFSIYWKWNKPIEDTSTAIEINLPVLDWQRYTNLSKQYNDDSLSNNDQ